MCRLGQSRVFAAAAVTLAMFVSGIRPAQGQTPADACAAGKVASAGQYLAAALDCHWHGANGEGPASDCLLRASRTLDAAFASIERGGASSRRSKAMRIYGHWR